MHSEVKTQTGRIPVSESLLGVCQFQGFVVLRLKFINSALLIWSEYQKYYHHNWPAISTIMACWKCQPND